MPANHPLPPHDAARRLRDLLLAVLTERCGEPVTLGPLWPEHEGHRFDWHGRDLRLHLDLRDAEPGVPNGCVQLADWCPSGAHSIDTVFFRFEPGEGEGSYMRLPRLGSGAIADGVVRALLLRAI